jgi:plastocyanin
MERVLLMEITMSMWKWMLSFALVFGVAACGSSGPTSQPQPTGPLGGYPGPAATVTLPPGYPAPGATGQGYPAPPQPVATVTLTATGGAPVFVTYKDFEIVPAQFTIPAGTTVTFLVESASGVLHQPYNSEPPDVFEAPADLSNGASWSFTFTELGAVTIRCRCHDQMTATITVTP